MILCRHHRSVDVWGGWRKGDQAAARFYDFGQSILIIVRLKETERNEYLLRNPEPLLNNGNIHLI